MWVCHLGRLEYRDGLALQERVRDARQRDELPDVLLLLEHPPVYTRGRRSEAGELPMGEDWYRSQGIDVVTTDRGGKLTYHGPGQLVGYPIMRITDVVAYLRTMEAAIIAALGDEGIAAGPRPGLTGVWTAPRESPTAPRESPTPPRKIASIGVHVSRGVTTHGFAVNVQNDLQPFGWVVPCGLEGVQMTSVLRETGRTVPLPGAGEADPLQCFRRRMAARFCEAHARRQRLVSERRLLLEHPSAPARQPVGVGA
jgi:lipoyl(octanoyl) transferase